MSARPVLVELDPADEVARVDADVVGFHLDGSAPPLVMLRTWDELGNMRRLARRLGPDRPLYALSEPWGEAKYDFPRTVEAWIDHHGAIAERLSVSGPYVLGGWSFGGMVALNVGEHLRALGRPPARVVLVDTRHPRRAVAAEKPARSVAHSIVHHLDRTLALPRPERPDYLRERARRLRRRVENRVGRPAPPQAAAAVDEMPPLQKAIRVAWMKYAPRTYDLPASVLWCDDSRAVLADSLLGWGRWLLGPVEAVRVGSGHFSVFREPEVEELARSLAAVTDRHT